MVSEHRSRGYSEHLLQQTFARITFLNGVAAVLAGAVAQVAAPSLPADAPRDNSVLF